MKTFYLIETEDRLIIDDKPSGDVQETVEASCWIEAKKKLGFELSALQTVMLEDKRAV